MEDKFSTEDFALKISEPLPTDAAITFNTGTCTEPLMEFRHNGEIYRKGKLLITDKEIVEGLKDIIQYYRCTKCKQSLT